MDIDVRDEETESVMEPSISPAANEDRLPVLTVGQSSAQEVTSADLAPGNQLDEVDDTRNQESTKHASTLATPAVRHLIKELNVELSRISGTGRDGRVLKEDVYRFVEQQQQRQQEPSSSVSSSTFTPSIPTTTKEQSHQQEQSIPLTPIQTQMFKSMTRSLSIPHFLYTDEYKLDKLTHLRKRLNQHYFHHQPHHTSPPSSSSNNAPKLTYLPFILKAISLALHDYPLLNSRLDFSSNHPRIVLRQQHNLSIAIATPSGLVVPVIRSVQQKSILDIAREITKLQALALAGRLSPDDIAGGTFTVSNIGVIGGTYVAPIIPNGGVAILGVGRARVVPAFADDDDDERPWDDSSDPSSVLPLRHPGESDGMINNNNDRGNDGRGRAGNEHDIHQTQGNRKERTKRRKGRRRREIIERTICHFSYSADHRVIDGAMMAQMAERVKMFVEEPELMVTHLH